MTRLRVSILGPACAPEPPGIAQFLADAGHDVELGTRFRRAGPAPDVVVAVSPPLRAVAAALRWRAPTRVGVIVQDLVGRRAERRLLRRAHGVVAVHESVRRSMVGLGVDADRITTIRSSWMPEVAACSDPAALRRDLGWRDDEIVALSSGPVGPGSATLVGAAALADELGLPVRFVLADPGDRPPPPEHLGWAGPTLQFLGLLPPATSARAMAAADVLVLDGPGGGRGPSLGVPAPYFAAGRPIVAAADPRSAVALDLEASGAGLSTPPGDAAELVETVLRVGADREEALAMGLRAELFARDTVSEAAARSAYVAWVEGLAAGRPVDVSPRVGSPGDRDADVRAARRLS